MKRKNATRSALFTSIISLLLCVSMLVGTTFAWFTDKVESGLNVINAGNLDVELYYSADMSTWTKVTANSNIFEDGYWEPGHTEVVYLKIANEGSLSLKYQLGVGVNSETGSINIEGNPFKLSDHIMYGVKEVTAAYANRAAAVADVTNATALNTSFNTDVLKLAPKGETGDSDIVALVVYMPESVGNEANHGKDQAVPTINLGLNVYATQVEAEDDSFGDDYDKNAWHDAMIITNETDLAAALANGGRVVIENNIELTKPLEVTKDVAVNLNGKVLSAKGEALNIANGAKVEIVNGTIESTAETENAITVTNTQEETITTLDLTDVTINFADVEDPNYNAILVNAEAGKAVLNVNEGTELNVVADWATPIFAGKNSEINVRGGEINVENTLYNKYCVWGIFVDDDSAVINIYDGVFNVTGIHSASGIYAESAAPTVNIYGGTFNVETSGTIGYGIAVEVYRGTVNATGGTFNIKATGGTAYAFEEATNLDLNVGSGVTINVWERDKNAAYESGMENPNDCEAVINVVYTVDENDDLSTVIDKAENGDTVTLSAGEYALPATVAGKTLTINGTEDTIVKTGNGNNGYVGLGGASLTFNGVTIQGQTSGQYNGYAHAGTMTYNNCTFEGTITIYSNSTFTNCTFNLPKGCYVWTAWGANEVTYEGCTFNTAGKALLVYHESGTCTVNVNNCVFNATAGDKAAAIANQNCAAIEIDNCGKGVGTNTACNFTVNTSGNTIDSDFSGEWRIKTCDPAAPITVNGEQYTQIAIDGKLMDLVAGTTNVVSIAGEVSVENANQLKNALTATNCDTITLNGTVDLGGVKGASLNVTNDITIQGGTIKGVGYDGELNSGVKATSGNIVFDGVTFDLTDADIKTGGWGMSVNVSGTAKVTFKNCTFKGTQCPIYQSGADSVVALENCTFDTTSVAIQCEVYSGDFQLGQDLIVKNCDFTGVADVLHIYDYDKNPSSEAIAQYLTDNGNTFTGTCKQTCK